MSKISFYREKNFKKTEIGEIPREWKTTSLWNIANYINGYPFSQKDWSTEGLPIIRIQNLTNPKAHFNHYRGNIEEKYIIESGDLLLSWSGSIGVYLWKGNKAVLNQHIYKVIPNSNVNKSFLYFVLQQAIDQLKKKVHGSTMQHFRKKELKKTYIPLPPLEEQKNIAKVLKDFDDLLENIEKQIKTLDRVKKGLMNIYFTKGVFKHETFKDTEIGRIPAEWEVKRVQEILEVGKSINGIKENEIAEKGKYPVINQGKGYILGFSDKEEFLIKDNLPLIVFGDHTCEVKYIDFPFIVAGEGVKILKPKKGINPLFFFYAVSKYKPTPEHYRRHFKLLKESKIPLPPLKEQKAIAERLKTIDDQIENLKKQKEHLQKVKKKFMELLLTGKIRVKLHS